MDNFLEIRNVSKVFDVRHARQLRRTIAIDDVSLNAETGTFLTIVGPSGCGKSTLLRIIAGLDSPTAGSVRVAGREVLKPSRSCGVVFQSPNLLPWRSAISNIELGLEVQRRPSTERAKTALRYLEMVGLKDYAHYYPGQMSGGMQQRVGIARALAIDPDVLLMDEPFAAVDAQTRLSLQEQLEQIWLMTKKSVVFITHDIEEAIFLSDRVVVMSGSPGKVIDDVSVGFKRPRDYAIRGTAEFASLVRRVLTGLRVRHIENAQQQGFAEEL